MPAKAGIRQFSLGDGIVMPALVAGIHVLKDLENFKGVDGRDKPGHDNQSLSISMVPLSLEER